MFLGQHASPARGARVRVPASTSNLGPGFDLVGLALDLPLTVELRAAPHGSGLRLTLGQGAERGWPTGPANLLLRGWVAGLAASQGTCDDAEFTVASEIPISRGLGSSAAAIVAGLVLGAALGARDVPLEELLERALALEGHPDNVTPALLGGCVLAMPVPGEPTRTVRQALHASLACVVAWPATTLETSFARSILPSEVRFADALENPRRLALLLEGLRTGDPDLLRLGSFDRLHVPYRLPHIPGGAAALDAARAAGAPLATISGSGSALFAAAPRAKADAVAAAMYAVLQRAAPPAQARVVEVAAGARLELLGR